MKKYYFEEKINNHIMKVSRFDGDEPGADFNAVEIIIYDDETNKLFSVYNEISKSNSVSRNKDEIFLQLIKEKKNEIRKKIRNRIFKNEPLPPMLQRYYNLNKRITWKTEN